MQIQNRGQFNQNQDKSCRNSGQVDLLFPDIAGKDLPLTEDVNCLTKPFAVHMLAQTVRDCLDKN